jgi:2-oxoglutarate ferredoxin oxidoreductase subunit beta
MVEIFKAAQEHKGVAFIEILQNCVIFNDKTWDPIYSREAREDNMLFLEEN